MKYVRRFGSLAGAAVCWALLSQPVGAAPVNFTITGGSYTLGTGYGIDASEGSGTLLDVRFAVTSASFPQNFSLDLGGTTFSTFQFGTVNLQEPPSNGGISPNETDNLEVTVNFVITSPSGDQQSVAVIAVVAGSVPDAAADYTLTFAPILVNFGTSGQYSIDVSDLTFTGTGSQNLNATFTLLSADQTTLPANNVVPEPSSILLLGGGLLGLTALRRRMRRK